MTRCTFQRKIFGRTISLQLDYGPGHAFYWEHIRLKYARRACEGQIQIAGAPEYPIERDMPAPGMLSLIATSKYPDHLPLHRLEGILSRQRLVLSRSTMCDWMKATAKILLPLSEYLIKRSLEKTRARRKFEHCLQQDAPVSAGKILLLIQQLYKVESDFKSATATRVSPRQL